MSRTYSNSERCVGKQLKLFRDRKEWSQLQLAEAAGVSERLVVKAESGGRLAARSIERLATALSRPERTVMPKDLTVDSEALAGRFIHAMYSQQSRMANAIQDFVHPQAVFNFVREPDSVPFAGVHRGLSDFEKAIQLFFWIYEVPNDPERKSRYQYYLQETDVAIWGQSWIQPIGKPLKAPAPVSMLLRFRNGLLCSMEDRCGFREGRNKDSQCPKNGLSNTKDNPSKTTQTPQKLFNLEDSSSGFEIVLG